MFLHHISRQHLPIYLYLVLSSNILVPLWHRVFSLLNLSLPYPQVLPLAASSLARCWYNCSKVTRVPATWSHEAGISQTETPLLLVSCLPLSLSFCFWVIFVILHFWQRISQCSLGLSPTHYVVQDGFRLPNAGITVYHHHTGLQLIPSKFLWTTTCSKKHIMQI